jgi:hypothetical protein
MSKLVSGLLNGSGSIRIILREPTGAMVPATKGFEQALTKQEHRILSGLTSPNRIQAFLDDLAYSPATGYRCPLRVLREKVAHCFDGALFGAAALRRLGHQPLILYMIANARDDDHLLALYKHDGHWGAIAKSNFVGLRFREPVYRTLRELVISYFEPYYNVAREKTLRSYTVPLNLRAYDKLSWMVEDEPLERIAERLDEIRTFPVLTRRAVRRLSPVDERSYRAGMSGLDRKGLFSPPGRRRSGG